jgi:hypothetical protein
MRAAWKQIVKTSTIVIGITLIASGILMMFLPLPGVLAVATGLAILARYFTWAADVLGWTRERSHALRTSVLTLMHRRPLRLGARR